MSSATTTTGTPSQPPVQGALTRGSDAGRARADDIST